MKKPRNKNLGLNPNDPVYDDDYDYEDELYRYEMEIEAEEEQRKLDNYLNKQ